MAERTATQLAKRIITRLRREGETLPADAVHELVDLISDAYDEMQRRGGGYDPRAYGVQMAQAAAQAFAASEYLGMTDRGVRYMQKYESDFARWKRVAAVEYHRSDIKEKREKGEMPSQADRIRRQIQRDQLTHPTHHRDRSTRTFLDTSGSVQDGTDPDRSDDDENLYSRDKNRPDALNPDLDTDDETDA